MSVYRRRRSFACPYCGAKLDSATTVDEEQGPPDVGSISVCFQCAGVGVFTGDGMRQPLDDEEREAIMDDPDVADAVGRLLAFRALNVYE